ncbi:MAG TPA: hypothetical protein VMU66_03075 [Gaiellales bacterium]|nr:hypothetical protein [Gaiellales bacterium]
MGGKFTSVRPAGAAPGAGEVACNGAAAVDIGTRQLLPWNPNVSGTVQAIAVIGGTAYLGGVFSTVGGKTHRNLAAVDASTGAVSAGFKAKTDRGVYSIAFQGSTLYACGAFAAGDGVARAYLAAFDGTTGALSNWPRPPTARSMRSCSPPTGRDWSSAGLSCTRTARRNRTSPPFRRRPGRCCRGPGTPPTPGSRWRPTRPVCTRREPATAGTSSGTTRPPARSGGWAAWTATSRLSPRWRASSTSAATLFALAGSNGILTAGGDFTKVGGVAQQGFAELPEITVPR